MPLEYADARYRSTAFLADAWVGVAALAVGRWLAPEFQLPIVGVALFAACTFWESGRRQASPGQRFIGLKAMHADGYRLRSGRAAARNLLWVLPLLAGPVSDLAAACAWVVLSVPWGRRQQTWYERLTRTAVIRLP